MKKLIVLVGEERLKREISGQMLAMGAATPVFLTAQPLEIIAEIYKLDKRSFFEKMDESFPKPQEITTKMLSRFASRLGMRPFPASYAGKTVQNLREAIDHLMSIAEERWGHDWPVRVFLDEYGTYKKGVFVLADGEPHADELLDQVGRADAVLVGAFLVKSDGTKLGTLYEDMVKVKVDHSEDSQDYKATTIKLLNQLKELFDKKRKVMHGN